MLGLKQNWQKDQVRSDAASAVYNRAAYIKKGHHRLLGCPPLWAFKTFFEDVTHVSPELRSQAQLGQRTGMPSVSMVADMGCAGWALQPCMQHQRWLETHTPLMLVLQASCCAVWHGFKPHWK